MCSAYIAGAKEMSGRLVKMIRTNNKDAIEIKDYKEVVLEMMKKIILWIWQFPQNILGLLIIKIMRAKYYNAEKHFKCPLFHSGVSLGNYIIFDYRIYVGLNSFLHEKGHQKQSLYLGWFYLPLIGLPSIIGNILHRFINFDYYSLPWEKWANKLGKVDG